MSGPEAVEPPPVSLWAARAQLLAVTSFVAAGVFGGVLLQLELWSPQATWSADRYDRMLRLHQVLGWAFAAPPLAGCFGYFVVSSLDGGRRLGAPGVAWLGFVLWVLGAAISLVLVLRTPEPTWAFYAQYDVAPTESRASGLIGQVLLAASGLVFAVHQGVHVLRNRRAEGTQVALTGAFVGIVAAACVVPFVLPTAGRPAFETVAALVLCTAALAHGARRRPQGVLTIVAVGCAIAWALMPFPIVALPLVGIWIAQAVLGGARPVVALVLFGAGPALLVGDAAAWVAHFTTDLHVTDTHFEVARLHLLGAVSVFAVLAAVHSWSPALTRREPHRLIAWSGALLTSGGVLLHTYASIQLGLEGMPRRYFTYAEQFTSRHQLAAIAGLMAGVGLITLVVAWIGGKPQHPAKNPSA